MKRLQAKEEERKRLRNETKQKVSEVLGAKPLYK